ncbi:hypothetical protein IWQ60_012587 [Tieghemiomyces parasiticus]|uniref:Uncharacterized protein n=1 Tax=Tieghemiomyces parasiticus TaxID=78921 RepID=A0A9W7ZGK9_9FUNG|nr:hypothetical protein IWQ60_012587 [Tieghemiomyces parasiticus]
MEQMFMQYVQPPSSSGPDHHHHQEPQQQHHKMHGFVIRVSMPMEVLLMFRKSIQQDRELCLPIKKGKVAPVSMRDVAHGWMKLMEKYQKRSFDELHQSHKHGIMCFTGPELVTGHHMAQEASEALDTEIHYKHVSEHEFAKYLQQIGQLSKEEIEVCVEATENVEQGRMEEQTKDLEKLLGKKPMCLRDFFEHHEDEFKPSH